MLLRAATITALIVCAVLASTPIAQAAQFRSGDQVTVSETEAINDDLYISGGQVQVDGIVSGDVIAAGGTININGDIKGNLIAAGGQINVDGKIAGSTRIAGGNLSVSGSIGRDLFAAGGSTSIASETTIAGDLILGTGTATISGDIGKRILGGAGTAELNGTVGRSVNLDVDSLTVGPSARIGGDLKYRSERNGNISDSAQISGTTKRSEPPVQRRAEKTQAAKAAFSFLSFAWLLAMGSVILALFPRSGKETSSALLTKPWQSLGIGFLVLIAVPPAVILLMISVVGLPLALVSLFIYIFFIYLTKVFAGLFIGDQLLRRIRGKESHWFWALLIGLVILFVLGLIPFIGWLVSLAVVLFGLGAIAIAFVASRRRNPETPGDTSSQPMPAPPSTDTGAPPGPAA